MRRRGAGVALLLGSLTANAALAVDLVRGPYLQRSSASRVVLRWTTDVATDTWVAWGLSPVVLDRQFSSPLITLEHRVELGGLAPATTYYYAVGSSTQVLAGGDLAHRLRTAPGAGSRGPARFWALGDSGTGGAGALAVRDGYAAFAGDVPPDLWLMLGDNAYPSGTETEYQQALFAVYPETLAASALWPALGNHDAISSDSATQSGPFFDLFSLPRFAEAGGVASATEAYYSFDHPPAHFVVLDTAESDLATGSAMLAWLDEDLARNALPWTIVLFHHPPYTKGSHDSDDPDDSGGRMQAVREQVLPRLEAAGVDLVLAGHSHGYERSYLLDGHYGPSGTFLPEMRLDDGDGDPAGDGPYLKRLGAHGGTLYVVAGNGARVDGTIEPHPAIAVGREQLGSLAIDVEGNQLDLRLIAVDGSVADHCRLLDGDLLFYDGFESGDLSGGWGP